MEKATQDELEEERVKVVCILKAQGYSPESVRISGGKWDGRECLVSERSKVFGLETGTLLTMDDCRVVADLKKVPEIVAKVEKGGDMPICALVDHNKDGGLWVSVIYVSADKTNWPRQEFALHNGEAWAYVATQLNGYEFEEGNIGIKVAIGGLVRTW